MIKKNPKYQRQKRVRNKLLSVGKGLFRLSVFRSNKHILAQIIDDKHGKTLVFFSSQKLKNSKINKIEQAKLVGEKIALLALKKNIKKIKFDRGCYKYHGRVKALADATRQGGLIF
ncbi:50S ribosomal protein L18 [Patescibacteria group bacterium]|nr:50S ribosomal protein L18 [Patescibacteria group bacterium]MCG2702437.1 50S ribosomal protein L18 [Candidatus Parcubacteria bacterium]MBU4210323.1 50S ribosomal protein L18 [Patescibacteria group bacterium]MBU4264513.1 50S ribosomal protein L18 [Patescibacteria group bacterium]MBU4390444.1 50S ribosomal protein L18 [Patescibacteria group bacterium]